MSSTSVGRKALFAVLPTRLQAIGVFFALSLATCVLADGMKEFDNRFEGTTVRPHGLEDFTLLGIHRNFESFSHKANLHVRFFLPPVNPKSQVSVEAAEIQDSFHYFMYSKSSLQWKVGDWNTFEPWPTNAVIDALGIQPDNLGVLAKYRLEGKFPVYLPVNVYENRKSSKQTYTFHLLSGQDLQSLEVTATTAAGMEAKVPEVNLKCPMDLHPNCVLFAAGNTLAFDLDMSRLPDGEYHLKLVGRVPGSEEPTSLGIALYHHVAASGPP